MARKSLDEIFGNITPNQQKSLGDIFSGTSATPIVSEQVQPEKGFLQKTGDVIGGLGAGVIKGIGSTALGISELGQKTIGRLVGAPEIEESIKATQATKEQMQPEGMAEKIGFGAEQIAEFFLPAAKAAKAEGLVNILSKGITSKLLSSSARIAGKGIVQGVASGGVKLAQTGGDIKEAGKVALESGIVRGAFATIGEGARALRLPERLYSTLFKNTADDMLAELRTETLSNLQKTNPEKFKMFVDRGIVKLGKSGQIEINPTVAKQALDTGLKGSIRNMTKTVIEGALDSEAKVQDAVKGFVGKVDLSEKQFSGVLKSIAGEYEDVGFGEISKEANRLAKALQIGKGNVTAEDALSIRRLLDRARVASSFDKPVSKLSLTQGNLKTLADAVRSRVNAIPGVGETMKNYAFYIEALETLGKEAARRGNNQAISLIDSLFLSGAFGATSPIPGFTAGMFRKWILSGPGMTFMAQLLNRSVASPKTIGAIGAITNTTNQINENQE